MFHKVKSVVALPDYMLCITFENGLIKKYDVKPLFKKLPIFQALQTSEKLFEQVIVDIGGYGISWNDDLDLSCDELWENGIN